MRAILVSAPDELRDRFCPARKNDLIERCARLRPDGDDIVASVKRALRRLARRCRMLN